MVQTVFEMFAAVSSLVLNADNVFAKLTKLLNRLNPKSLRLNSTPLKSDEECILQPSVSHTQLDIRLIA
jgi:hypothetical protein